MSLLSDFFIGKIDEFRTAQGEKLIDGKLKLIPIKTINGYSEDDPVQDICIFAHKDYGVVVYVSHNAEDGGEDVVIYDAANLVADDEDICRFVRCIKQMLECGAAEKNAIKNPNIGGMIIDINDYR